MNTVLNNLKKVRFWTETDFQDALDYLAQNEDEYQQMVETVLDNEDFDTGALLYCIKDGFAETFERFDSDVAEKFIDYFKELFLN